MTSGHIAGRAWLALLALLYACALSAATDEAAPPMLLAERYDGKVDPARYWVSEKLDGVRAYWDGKRLRFRSGREVAAPAWFVAALPTHPLDGELWAGRGTFSRLSGIVRRSEPVDDEWHQVRYMIFELPEAPGDFTTRAARIREVVAALHAPWIQVIDQFRVADARELQRRLVAIVKAGGEGLMLHQDDAPYVTGRSPFLLKVTPWRDAEARVIAHIPGKGKHAGRLGALRVETADGKRFSLGTGFSDGERTSPPAIGTLVTYRYRELTPKGLPRFPRYLRVREEF